MSTHPNEKTAQYCAVASLASFAQRCKEASQSVCVGIAESAERSEARLFILIIFQNDVAVKGVFCAERKRLDWLLTLK